MVAHGERIQIDHSICFRPADGTSALWPEFDATQNWRGSLRGGVTCSVTETHSSRHPMLWVRYN